ncbi:hypothetical protein K504DRAFT_496674 [Pleomassaria siparia CBS 279.74]|uniref:Uncharacterized protein n=1 Tax=Pleomassaria siparia CBS 279.74 TaxID=1314801 RepID=A0A6G1KPK0_9PLEO|nr:hypothetical protein K504DRAFT_496674 [Pleomassaria siparia CBS 279.74]
MRACGPLYSGCCLSLHSPPWPFTVEDDGVDGFRLDNAPFYKVEMWDPASESELAFNAGRDCELYGGFHAVHEYSTIIFSRSEFTIQDVSWLSKPVPQTTIAPSSLFTSLNTVLYRPNQTTNDFRYDRASQPYMLTQVIGSTLFFSLNQRAAASPFARDWLRNLLALPLYVFQPTSLAVDKQVPRTDNGTLPQPGLAAENYVEGSYCVVSTRAVPDRKTVVGYAAAGLVVFVFVGVGKGIACRWDGVETSDYAVVDFNVPTVGECRWKA